VRSGRALFLDYIEQAAGFVPAENDPPITLPLVITTLWPASTSIAVPL